MPKNKKQKKGAVQIPGLIVLTAKILEFISLKMAAKFAMKLFTTPVKFALPKREEEMDRLSRQEDIPVPTIGKTIRVYHLGEGTEKILLVHGWSGRGTQLCSIAEKMVKNGYSTISFDGPAHGKSTGKTSDMTEFIASIHELDKKYGPFTYMIGHSLGAMAVLNSIKQGVQTEKAVTIGSGDMIQDIMDDFTMKLGMNIATGKLMIAEFEKKFNTTINSYSAYIAAQQVTVPVLVIHDEDDADVPVTAAYHIQKHLAHSRLLITKGLGHRKIMGDKETIKTIIQFLEA